MYDGRNLADLASLLEESSEDLSSWLVTIPMDYKYHSFSIPKRNGSKRYIEAPNDQLKSLQKKIYNELLREETIQTAATGFVPNRSIVDNAIPHLDAQIIVKIDLMDFFGSIGFSRVYKYWAADGWNAEASTVLSQICCYGGSLPQGAPTSPALSNVINSRLDYYLIGIARKNHATYTRYADDMTFSFRNGDMAAEANLRPMLHDVRARIEGEDYRVQWSKGIKILRSHQRQIVTGLIVNERLRLPRQTRNLIRALQHKRLLNSLSEFDLKRLEGYENLALMVQRRSSSPSDTSEALIVPKKLEIEVLPPLDSSTEPNAVVPSSFQTTIVREIKNRSGKNLKISVDPVNHKHVTTNFYDYNFDDFNDEEALGRLINKLYDYPEAEFYYYSKEHIQTHAVLIDACDENVILMDEKQFFFYKNPRDSRHYIRIDPNSKNASVWETDLAKSSESYIRIKIRLTQKATRDLELQQGVEAIKEADKSLFIMKPTIGGLGFDLRNLWKAWKKRLGF